MVFRKFRKKIEDVTTGKIQQDSKKASEGQDPEARRLKREWLRKRSLMFTSKGEGNLNDLLNEFNKNGEDIKDNWSLDASTHSSTKHADTPGKPKRAYRLISHPYL